MGGPKNYKQAVFKSLVIVAVLVVVIVVAMPPSRSPGIQGAQIGPAVITSDHVDYDASLPSGKPGKQRGSVTPATIATIPVGDNPVRISGSILAAAAGTVKSEQKISATAGGFTGELDQSDLFGGAIASLGDLDGDFVSDLAVGARDDRDGGFRRGAVWVLFMNADGTVKSHQKISATAGGFTGDLDDSDRFGVAIASLGDLDGDGVSDLAVGAQGDDDGGTGRGAVWILFMNADGTVKSHQKISDTAGGFTGVLADGDQFGVAIANLGDLDGDAVSDLAVGANLDDDGGTDRGAVWVLFMNADGTVKSHQKISDTDGGFTGGLRNGNHFGESTASLGDLNGDGVSDLAVGTSGDGVFNRGAVWVLFMNADGTVKSHQKISDTDGGFTGVLDDRDFFGTAVASLGDLDGDGVSDLAVGAILDDDGGTDRGAVWILFMNADGTVKSHQKISDTAGGFAGVLDDLDEFGGALANLGDLDGDGVSDLAVGAPRDDDGGGTARGAVWVLFMNGVVTCVVPDTGDMIVTKNCILAVSATAPGNVIVEQNIALTIAENASLDIDFTSFHLKIKNGAKVVIKTGGKIF